FTGAGILRWVPLLIVAVGLALTLAVLGYVASAWKTKQINAARAQLRGMLDGLGPLAWLLTPNGTVISAKRAATAALRRTEEEMTDRPLWDLPLTFEGTDQSGRIRQAVQAAHNGEEPRFDFSVEIDGQPRVLDLWVRRLGDDPRTSNLVASAVDVTDRQEA